MKFLAMLSFVNSIIIIAILAKYTIGYFKTGVKDLSETEMTILLTTCLANLVLSIIKSLYILSN